MTRLQTKLPLADGLMLDIDRSGSDFFAIVGGWVVETLGGNLVVRIPNRPANEMPLLRVPLRVPDRP